MYNALNVQSINTLFPLNDTLTTNRNMMYIYNNKHRYMRC